MLDRASALVVLSTLGVAIWVWWSSNGVPRVVSQGSRREETGHVAQPFATSQQPLQKDDPLWNQPLQFGIRKPQAPIAMPQAKPEAVPALVVAPSPAPSHLGLRLLGTILEHDRSWLIAIDRKGNLDFQGPGSDLSLEPNGVHVDTIKEGSAQVSYRGNSRVWRLGEFLSFDELGSNESAIKAKIDSKAPPKLSVEEELDRMNRLPNMDP